MGPSRLGPRPEPEPTHNHLYLYGVHDTYRFENTESYHRSLMAAISLSSPTLTRTHFRFSHPHIQSRHFPPFSLSSAHLLRRTTRIRFSNPKPKWALAAYVTGPASDYSVSDPDPKIEGSGREKVKPEDAISWGTLWSLLVDQKWRLALCVSALVGGTTCTLSMPLFSGIILQFIHQFVN